MKKNHFTKSIITQYISITDGEDFIPASRIILHTGIMWEMGNAYKILGRRSERMGLLQKQS
jgi:hypothetical protein